MCASYSFKCVKYYCFVFAYITKSNIFIVETKSKMKYSIKEHFKISEVIQKTLLRTKRLCQGFAENFFANLEPINFDDALKIFEEALFELTSVSKKDLRQKEAIAAGQVEYLVSNELVDDYTNDWAQIEPAGLISDIVWNQDKEKNYVQGLQNQQKQARIKFFNQQIKQVFNDAQIKKQDQKEMIHLLTKDSRRSSQYIQKKINQMYGKKSHYNNLTGLLEIGSRFVSMRQQFQRKIYERPAIAQMAKLKLTSLKTINIQSRLQYICAFELFKVVHQNKSLSSVTVKVDKINRFNQFVNKLSLIKKKKIQIPENEEYIWMKYFKPSKFLKISINPIAFFYLLEQKSNYQFIKDLVKFGKMFHSFSNIQFQILCCPLKQLQNGKDSIQNLLEPLKIFKKIKFKIDDIIYDQLFDAVLRTIASFKEIISLKLQRIRIRGQLDVKQSLKTLFQNNPITHLKFQSCHNLPIFPKISTLQTLSFIQTYFKEQLDLIKDFSNQQQAIKYQIISKQQLDNLQELQAEYSGKLILAIESQSPSSMKHLTLYGYNYAKDYLLILFPKLVSLTYLKLSDISIGHEIICVIPSMLLRQLQIYNNQEIQFEDLEAIDNKWPYLRKLVIDDCPNLKIQGWGACEFKGLIELCISSILAFEDPIRQQLIVRGIKVY